MSQASRERERQRRLAAIAASSRPRNPTGPEIRGERGHIKQPPLSNEEWMILRNWQAAQMKEYMDTPAAAANRTHFHLDFDAGTLLESIPAITPPELYEI
jgi:hypothetical protein